MKTKAPASPVSHRSAPRSRSTDAGTGVARAARLSGDGAAIAISVRSAAIFAACSIGVGVLASAKGVFARM